MTSFDSFSLRPETRAALTSLSLTEPTPIQAAALPEMLAGRDVIGQARTGSGKTLAFALPMVERMDERQRAVQALVLVPTRELAAQVADVVRSVSGRRPLGVLLLVGGTGIGAQKQALRQGVHVVVGTPGRVLDLARQGVLRFDRLRLLVLDEADEMLDRGFAPDVERIIAGTNSDRQTALFSATVPAWVETMSARYLRDPASVKVDTDAQPVENVVHAVYDVPDGGKLAALRSLLDARGPGVTLVFGRTKHGVKKLARHLEADGYPVAALQGNLSQNARDRVMAQFRAGETPILIATNVAARGLDVEHVAQVINYELPETADLLTHRVGRTGRMGRDGEAITLLTSEDDVKWRRLSRDLRRVPTRRPWRGRHEPGAPPILDTNAAARRTLPATSAPPIDTPSTPRLVARGAPARRVASAAGSHGRRTVRTEHLTDRGGQAPSHSVQPGASRTRPMMQPRQPMTHDRTGHAAIGGHTAGVAAGARAVPVAQREGNHRAAPPAAAVMPRPNRPAAPPAAPAPAAARQHAGNSRRRGPRGRGTALSDR